MRSPSKDKRDRYSDSAKRRRMQQAERLNNKSSERKTFAKDAHKQNVASRQKHKQIKKTPKADFSAISKRESELRRSRRAINANRRKKKQDRIKKVNSGMTMIFILFICIGLYLVRYSIVFFSKDGIPFDTIQYGSIDEPNSVNGIIVRDETVYSSAAAGVVVYNVSDNDRVKKGSVVCTIKDESTAAQIESELNDINESIIAMQENREDLSIFSEDVKRINSQIKVIIDENTADFSQYNLSGVYELKSDLQKKIDSRNQMLLSENRGSLKELVEKRSSQESELSNSILNITAVEGGIVSYYFDGLEDTLTIDKLDSIIEEQVNMTTEFSEIKTVVAANDKVFRIINSNEWYIAAYVPSEYIQAENWKEGDTVSVSINNDDGGSLVEAQVYKLTSSEGSDKNYVVLKITKDLIDYIDKRSITFEIGKSQVGLKIPKNAIVERTILKIPVQYVDNDTVHISDESQNGENILPITNSGGSEDGTIVYTPKEDGGLQVGTKIVNPKDKNDVYEIKENINIKGIYIINTGLAEFKTINSEGSSENSTHIIIKPENNPKIRLYDRVVTDTEGIVEQQNVYK